jgi:hypothetical protein
MCFSEFNAQSSGFEFEKCSLSFQPSKSELTLETKQVIDSAWDKLDNEQKVEFNCLSNYELNKLSDKNKYKLSLERSQKIEQYLYEKEISPRYINYNIDYFDHLTNGNCGTKESIKGFKNIKGIISPLLEKGTYYRRTYNASESNTTSETCQEFKIDAFEENIIEGKQGTTIKFPYECFDMDYTKENREISVLLCEYYSLKDIVLSGLTTVSNEAVLETGGMIYLEAYVDGKQLKLKKGVDIQIVFPFKSNKVKDDMLSFEGEKKDGLINWNTNEKGAVTTTDNVLGDEDLGGDFFLEGEGEGVSENFWKLDGYLMNTNKLGWINCDRFIEDYISTELIVKIQSKEKNFGTRIFFTDMMSILPLYEYSSRNEHKHSRLPVEKEVFVITYTILKDKETALFAYEKIITGQQKRIKLTPIEMPIKELYAQLDILSKS